MKSFILLTILFACLALAVPAAEAQVYTVADTFALSGGFPGDGIGKDTLQQTGENVSTPRLDSLHAFLEHSDSINVVILASPVHAGIFQTEAQILADTVRVKAAAKTKAGTIGVTYQELKQAFAGAVPPTLRFFQYVYRRGTGKNTDGGSAVMLIKEITH
ncbi:MAG: hypothetical protein HY962_07135 [Ignavibacteriae bacterium]|nr:hypothetical protein [Ignavibacteriota bacterium]